MVALFKNIFAKFKRNSFLKILLTDVKHENVSLEAKQDAIYIFTITYNNELLLQHQIDLLNKNLRDPFVFVVADNSPNPAKRDLIAEICRKNKIGYISLPKNPEIDGSDSHSICLNWLYKNYISLLKPHYFGFIDHDVFCIKSTSIIDTLRKQTVYGCYQGREGYWYLWAGLCFFDFKKTKDKKLDFSVCLIDDVKLDTGGANWYKLYSGLKKEELEFPKQEYVTLRDGESIQSSNVEIMDSWLHSFNGSYWLEMPEKENLLFDFLQKYYK